MSNIGENHPGNPFSPSGRAAGRTQSQLKDLGFDGMGYPATGPGQPRNEYAGPYQPVNGQASNGFGPSGPSRPGGTRNQNIGQLAQSIGSMELANQDDLYAFCEAIRAILNYLAISVKLAEGQLKGAARAQAKQAKDGWMTPAQIGKLVIALRGVGKDLNRTADACVDGAAGAVKAWRRFETLLDELQNDDGRRGPRRPGGRRSFNVV